MDTASAVAVLSLFNEKSDKLESLSFTEKIAHSGVTISGKLGKPVQAERQGPDDESIDAFVLTMRYFVQDNEPTSFRHMAELYSKLSVTPDLVQKFNDARTKTNAGLDKSTPVNLNNEVLTYRAVFDTFLWGGLAHANPKKKARYDVWAKNPILFPLLQNEFVFALGILLNMIFFTRALNTAAISQLGNQS